MVGSTKKRKKTHPLVWLKVKPLVQHLVLILGETNASFQEAGSMPVNRTKRKSFSQSISIIVLPFRSAPLRRFGKAVKWVFRFAKKEIQHITSIVKTYVNNKWIKAI